MKKVVDIFNLIPVEGEVGVEIEMEGENEFPYRGNLEKYWRATEDGSLRGYSAEYVMKQPLELKDVPEALDILSKAIERKGTSPVYSERAGVHVHVNMQQCSVTQVYAMAFTYYCLEHALTRFCGENREGNHFCLRLKDASYTEVLLRESMRVRNFRVLMDDNIRYSALNWCSLAKYGSLEFRSMETMPDLSKIYDWCDMLLRIKRYAMDINEYSEIPMHISGEGPTFWAKNILGERLFNLIDFPDFDNMVYECMRPIQPLFYKDF